ncbi:unnamed protein product [Rhizopus stolonifer]
MIRKNIDHKRDSVFRMYQAQYSKGLEAGATEAKGKYDDSSDHSKDALYKLPGTLKGFIHSGLANTMLQVDRPTEYVTHKSIETTMASFLHLPSFQYNENDYQSTMLLNQSEPQPEKKSPPDKFPPNLIRRGHQMIPSRPESFITSTFHSNPRYRTTEAFTLFDIAPAFSSTRQFYELCNLEQTNR